MFGSALILFREGLEGALIVAIVLSYLRRLGRRDAMRPVWFGVAAAAALSLVAGAVLFATVGELEGSAEAFSEAVIGFLAAAVLTWMIFWMRREARAIKGQFELKVDLALTVGSTTAMVGVVFFGVAREGLETSLFFLAAAGGEGAEEVGTSAGAAIVGGLLGLAVAVALGYAFYRGSRWLDLRQVFTVSGGLILIFAAGLLTSAVAALQELGLGSVWSPVYDVSGVESLGDEAFVGGVLNGLIGWSPAPSVEMIMVWLAYLAIVGSIYLRGLAPLARPTEPQPVQAQA